MSNFRESQIQELMHNLEESSDRLAQLVEISESVAALATRQDIILNTFEKCNTIVEQAGGNLKEIQSTFLSSIDQGLVTLKEGNADHITDLKKAATNLSVNAEETTNHLKGQIGAYLTEFGQQNRKGIADLKNEANKGVASLQKNLESINHTNRQNYSDLESLIRLKLADHKAEIKQLIEYERSKIRELVEGETLKTENHLHSVNQQVSGLLKSQKTQQFTLWSILAILLGLSITAVLKIL